jgi:predicted ester cyclase
MTKSVAVVASACLLLAACAPQPRDLVPLAKRLDVAVNAHDMDQLKQLITDDCMVHTPMGGMVSGKDSVMAWMEETTKGFHVDSWGYEQSGDTVRWMSTVSSDAFRKAGIPSAGFKAMVVFSGDKMKLLAPMFTEETKGKLKFSRFITDVINEGKVDEIDNFLSDDFVEHQELPPGLPAGREGVKGIFKMMHEAFPDLHSTPLMVIGDGDLVGAYQVWEGTNKGKFMGKAPTNRKVKFDVFDLIRIKNGKATEHWGVEDDVTMMRQLQGK